MSGPKVHHYRVTSAEEIRRREDEARRAKCKALEAKCREIATGLESPETATIPTLSKDNHEGLQVWEAELIASLKRIALQLDKENARRIVERLRSRMDEIDVSGVSLGIRRAQPHRRNPKQQSNYIANEIRVLAPLLGKVRDLQQASELAGAIERLAECDDEAVAKGDLLTLKSKLSDLLLQQDMRDLADMEMSRVAHLNGREVDALRQRAKTVKSKEDLDTIKKMITEMLAAEKAKQDESFVVKALEEVLLELGFEAAGGFEVTDFGEVAIAECANYPGYALRLQVNAKNGMILTRMVAFESHDVQTDEEIERTSCDDIKSLRELLEKRGVQAELTGERAPGERPIEILDGAAVSNHMARRGRTSAGKVMTNAR